MRERTNRIKRRASLAALCVLGLAPAPGAQTLGQGVTTVGSLEANPPTVTSGTHNVSMLMTPATDAKQAFKDAIDALPPQGGEVVILPAVYRFETALEITRSGVTLRGTRGVVLVAANANTGHGILRVTGDDFTLAGVTVEIDGSAGSSSQAALELVGARAIVRDCAFRVDENATGPDDARMIALAGGASGAALLGNRFELPSAARHASVTPVVAAGVERLRILNNAFAGGLCVAGLELDACRGVTIQGNTFAQLVQLASGSAMVAVRSSQVVTIGGNSVEACEFARLFDLFQMSDAIVAGNQLGATLADGNPISATGVRSDADRVVVAGNQFAGFGGASTSAVRLAGTPTSSAALVSGNQFTRCRDGQVTSSDYDHVALHANQFVLDSSAPAPALPVEFLPPTSSGHMLHGNSASNSGALTWSSPTWVVPDTSTSFAHADLTNWLAPTVDDEPGFAFCFGDGSGAPCPCGNESPVPGQGCKHGLGPVGMEIRGSGSTSIAADDLALTVENCQPMSSAIFFVGTSSLDPGCVLGNGLRCAGGCILRFGGTQCDLAAMATDTGFVAQSLGQTHCTAPYFDAGCTYVFQFWMRDPAGECGAGSNLSPGYQVTMVP